MSGDKDSGIGSVLSEREIDSLRFAQDLYGARAKEAAAGLAETLGLDEEARQQLVGGVALKLEGLDFEERRRVAQGFQELSVALGGTVVKGFEASTPILDLVAVTPKGQPETSSTIQNPHDTNSGLPNGKEMVKDPLNRQQRSWLLRLYDEEDVITIESLSIEQRVEFVGALTRRYCALKIMRLDTDAKRARSEQLTSLMAGKSYKEIAAELGIQEGTLVAGMVKMTESIKKRVNSAQLKRLIPTPSRSTTLEAQTLDTAQEDEREIATATDNEGAMQEIDTSETGAESTLWTRTGGTQGSQPETLTEPALSKEQVDWLNKLLGEENVDLISKLSAEDRVIFASALAERYKTLKVNRLEPAGKQKRAEIIVAFMGEKPHTDVAKDFKLSPFALLNTLDRISGNFSKKVTKSELISLIPGEGIALTGPGENIEKSKSTGLSKIQQKWLGKVFEDWTAAKEAEEFTSVQMDHLSELLGRRLNAAVIRVQGPTKTARRLQQLKLLLQGESYEEIAAVTGTDLATTKGDLHHSALRLKITTPQEQLEKIMRDAKLKTEE